MAIARLCLLLPLLLLWLNACTSGSDNGAQTTRNPNTQTPDDTLFVYRGPPPATDDVQQFRLALWDNIVAANRCGQCHSETGNQAPMFARGDDLNLAYAAANSVVNLDNPGDSAMVQKFSGGHYCWEVQNSVCADILERWISDWASATAGAANVVELTPPPLREPGSSRSFPQSSSDFASTVYPLLKNNCAACHTENAANPQSPFLASDDVDTAYFAAQSKINLDFPAISRLVIRLREEGHNCWSGSCSADADVMQQEISAFAGTIPLSTVDPDYISSKSLRLTDGIIASSGGRFEDNLIALYQFKTGEGSTAFDTSGVGSAMHLTLSGDYQWVGGWGIQLNNGKAQAKVEDSKKLHQLITATGEYSVEAWVAPNNVVQEGPSRIISYSAGNNARNFMLGQSMYNYDFYHRSTTTDANGEEALSTPDGAQILQATLQHVVMTFDGIRGRQLFINGEKINQDDPAEPGNLSDWDDSFALVLGSETSNQFRWQGVIRLLAVYNRALTAEQVAKNFDANVGERFLLLFNVSHLVDVADAYIVFEVSQFDSYAYLFSQPFFISLDSTATFSNIPLQGLHIGINGKLASAGQAFVNVDVLLSDTDKNDEGRVYLSPIGTVIALDSGPAQDEFYLVFDRLGDKQHAIVEAQPAPPVDVISNEEQADIGIKTFDEINASMARVTGIPATQVAVAETFTRIKQQLPTVDNIGTFLSSQQVAISQLAIEYCSALMEDSSLRSAFFPQLNFNKPAGPRTEENTAFYDESVLFTPLVTRIIGEDLYHDPSLADIQDELSQLLDALTSCGADCDSERTKTVSKAVCAAVLASAPTLLQ